MSSTPLYTTRIKPAVKRLLPPASPSGAASSITTLAPCSCAASAAQNAALPPPTTITSYSDIVPPAYQPLRSSPRKRGPTYGALDVAPGSPLAWGRTVGWLAIRSILYHAPLDRFAPTIDQRLVVRPLDLHLLGCGPGRFLDRDGLAVGRQLVVAGAVKGSEGLKLVERALLLEHLGVGRDCHRRVEQARNAVNRKLLRDWVRCRVGAEEITSLARGRGLA